MKRLWLAVLLLASIGLSTLYMGAAAAEWDDEFPITQDPVPQDGLYPAVSPGDVLYVSWPDRTVWEDTKILLMKSEDKGESWTEADTIFAGKTYDDMALHANADGLHLLLVEFIQEGGEHLRLYYSKSIDGGQSFSDTIRIGHRDFVTSIALFSDDSTLFTYARSFDRSRDLYSNYLYVSDDGGATWEEKSLLPDWSIESPSFAVSDGLLHIAFGGVQVQSDIVHSTSADHGDNWTPPVPVSFCTGPHAQLAQVAVDANAIHVAWEDDRAGDFNIVYSRSVDGGVTWSSDVQLNDTYYGARVQMLSDEEGLHVAWCQYHGAVGWPVNWSSADYGIVWYKSSLDSGIRWSDEVRVSQNEHIPPMNLPDQGANHCRLVEYDIGFSAFWMDKRDGNIDLYMRNNRGVPADIAYGQSQSGSIRTCPLWSSPAGRYQRNLSVRVSSDRGGQILGHLVNAQGRVEAELPPRQLVAGADQIVCWSAPHVAEGVYYVRLMSAGVSAAIHRLVLIR